MFLESEFEDDLNDKDYLPPDKMRKTKQGKRGPRKGRKVLILLICDMSLLEGHHIMYSSFRAFEFGGNYFNFGDFPVRLKVRKSYISFPEFEPESRTEIIISRHIRRIDKDE